MRRSLHIGLFIGTLLGAAACGPVPEPESLSGASVSGIVGR